MNSFGVLGGRHFFALILTFALSACAVAPSTPWHAFSFDGWSDKWAKDTELLEFSYGDKYPMVRRMVQPGYSHVGYRWSVNGPMPVGEFLYVKWRIKATGVMVEDRVDLRALLVTDMTGYRITFVIDGSKLYVYLVTPVAKHESDPPLLKTTESRYHLAYEIYPNNTYRK